jgi:hypothetical protein
MELMAACYSIKQGVTKLLIVTVKKPITQYQGGFSFADFQAQINAGNPVMLNLAGHTIVGLGYDTAANTVYVHDTWDYLTHTMTWGTSYSGMQLLSVSIVNIAKMPKPIYRSARSSTAPRPINGLLYPVPPATSSR